MGQVRTRRKQRGQIFLLLAILIPVLIVFAGFAIDLGLAYITKTTLSKAVDAAALAAMRNLSQGQNTAKTIAQNEFNVAAGTGDRKSAALRQILGTGFAAPLIPARNEMIFANYIFRPRSDLVFSAEYRRLRTYEITGAPDRAGQVGLSVGFLF